MQQLDGAALHRLLDMPALIAALRAAFAAPPTVPPRHHHSIAVPGGAEATLLLMPAWQSGAYLGIKLATIFPDNADKALPSVQATYLFADGTTGVPLALIDGNMLTLRRTAAASGLAADYLARRDAAQLLMVGTGALIPHLIEAHRAVRPIAEVTIWGRDPEKARRLAHQLASPDLPVSATADIAAAAGTADVISCATLAHAPLIQGAWLKPGAHLDLVGAFTPDRRESDDAAIERSKVYVDGREGATREGGDIAQPLASGLIAPSDILGDLFELCDGRAAGRQSDSDITLFKSVGHALEDLAAAELAYTRHRAKGASAS